MAQSHFAQPHSLQETIISPISQWLRTTFEFDSAQSRLISMEGLRGLAVTLVFLVHYTTLARPWVGAGSSTDYVVEMLHSVGNTGVDLFFVLSGYLIYGTLIEKRKAFGPYFARRIERIYPVFAVVTAVYLVLFFVFPSESKLPAGAGSAVLFVLQNLIFMPGLFPVQAINTVTWSLSYEMFYYLVMPLLIALVGMRTLGAGCAYQIFPGTGCGAGAGVWFIGWPGAHDDVYRWHHTL